MAYRIVKNAAVWWPVRWNDVEESGEVVEREIEVKLKRFGKAELAKLKTSDFGSESFMKRVAVDWRGFEDEDGTPVPFDKSGFDRFFDLPGRTAEAFSRAFQGCLASEPERRLGNSRPSPADGGATATDLSQAEAGSEAS